MSNRGSYQEINWVYLIKKSTKTLAKVNNNDNNALVLMFVANVRYN